MTGPARKRAGLMEMAAVAGDEARRLRFTEQAIVKCGLPTDAGQLRKAEVFEDIERLIFAIQPVREQVLKAVRPVLEAMATADNFKQQEPEPPAPEPTDDE